jgi:hypothetical protein
VDVAPKKEFRPARMRAPAGQFFDYEKREGEREGERERERTRDDDADEEEWLL